MYSGLKTFGKIIEFRANEKPDARFIRFEEDELTFGQANTNGNKMANVIQDLGLKKGDTCAVMLPNSPEFLAAWIGLAKLGVVEVPINTAYRGDLFKYILNKAECKAIVISAQWLDRLQEISGELTTLQHVIVVGEDYQPLPRPFETNSFDYVMENASDAAVNVDIKPSDTSLIMFTSGTTGPSKGVILPHSANFKLAEHQCVYRKITPEDRIFTFFPLFHINARYTQILAALVAGADVVLHNRFSASKFWDICKVEKVTQFGYMGSVLTILLKNPPRSDDKDHTVRQACGAPAPPEIYDEFVNRFGVKIHEGYGSTETGTACINHADSFRPGSCGKANPHYEVAIHDENDNALPPGEEGEIVVRPKEPGVIFTGYYGMPEETVKAWKNLWFHTGDRGRMDEDGYVYFVDRKKDAIRRRGENISSFEVERVINDHPKVLEGAAIGVPSELTEEEVLVAIELKAGEELKPEELLDYCQPRMAHFAIPRYVRFVSKLPRTPNEKVQKYILREEGITSDTWDRQKVGYEIVR